MAHAQAMITSAAELQKISQVELANYAASIQQFLKQTTSSTTAVMNDSSNMNELDDEDSINEPEDKENEFDKEVFIEVIRNNKCLWDLNSPEYKNKQMKIAA